MKQDRPFNPWSNPPESLIAVGEVLGTQGNRGEVKVASLTDHPERWLELERVLIFNEEDPQPLFLEKVRFFKGLVIVKFRGINDISGAEVLQGTFLWLPEAERPPLPPDRFYVDQIIGLKVYTLTGCFLGAVAQVLFTGGNDVYVLRGGTGGEILLPALKSVIRSVDLAAGIMRVELPPGLVDEDQERC
ncbi:MAG TPA: 16S rRNA processing protein RimM [Firmicutes bacterium]|jgi:16S rRNA processing protein RimM|nr:16S rRNA processing protein RimM [Bacillota bacterium]